MIRETAEIGVVVERRTLKNPWVDHSWTPVALLIGAPTAAPWTILEQSTDFVRYYAGTIEIEFFGSDTTMYRENLHSQKPSLWVALRHSDLEPGVTLLLATADPAEVESLTETGTDIIEALPMPPEIRQQLASFVEKYHVERPFIKRTRDRADPNAMTRRGPNSESGSDKKK